VTWNSGKTERFFARSALAPSKKKLVRWVAEGGFAVMSYAKCQREVARKQQGGEGGDDTGNRNSPLTSFVRFSTVPGLESPRAVLHLENRS